MLDKIIEFFGLHEANVRWVMLGMIFLGINSAVIGAFAFLRQKALTGDAVAHAILPGICIGFLVSGEKNNFWLLLGAVFTGWLALQSINYLIQHTKIKGDGAIALVLSVFYGIGIVLLTKIQKMDNANQAGLDKFLFGKAAAIVYDDVILAGIVCFISILFVSLFFHQLKIFTFDIQFAKVKGLPITFFENSLSFLLIVAIAVGIQAVGVVLMSALLLTPIAVARYWTYRLHYLLIIASFVSVLATFLGATISYQWSKMPTGPWVVVILSFFLFSSFIIRKIIKIWKY
jgi:manganese/zinc/iron transport system permease protein